MAGLFSILTLPRILSYGAWGTSVLFATYTMPAGALVGT